MPRPYKHAHAQPRRTLSIATYSERGHWCHGGDRRREGAGCLATTRLASFFISFLKQQLPGTPTKNNPVVGCASHSPHACTITTIYKPPLNRKHRRQQCQSPHSLRLRSPATLLHSAIRVPQTGAIYVPTVCAAPCTTLPMTGPIAGAIVPSSIQRFQHCTSISRVHTLSSLTRHLLKSQRQRLKPPPTCIFGNHSTPPHNPKSQKKIMSSSDSCAFCLERLAERDAAGKVQPTYVVTCACRS